MPPRRHKKRPASLGRRVIRCLVASTILLVLCATALAFYEFLRTSENFAIKNVRVHGNLWLSDTDIITGSELTTADNVFFFDRESTEAKVEALPYVRSCHIKRGFPDFIEIEVIERVGEATLMVGGATYEVDGEGIVLREVPITEEPVGALLTNVPDLSHVTLADDLSRTTLMEGLAVWKAFQTIDMAREVTVSEISVAERDNIRMYCDDLAYEIRWGRGDYIDQAKKLQIWRQLGDPDAKYTQYVDLRFGADVICK